MALRRNNVFEMFDDEQLIKRYHLDRAGNIFVNDLVRDVISRLTLRSNAFSQIINHAISTEVSPPPPERGFLSNK